MTFLVSLDNSIAPHSLGEEIREKARLLQGIHEGSAADAPLFEEEIPSEPIEAEVVVEGRILGVETGQIAALEPGLPFPEGAVIRQRLSVHEEPSHPRETAPELKER